MSFFQNIYAVLFRPGAAFKELSYEYNSKFFFQAILLFALSVTLSNHASSTLIVNAASNLLIFSLLVFLLQKVFNEQSKPSYFKLLSFLAIANLPLVLIAPIKIFALSSPFIATLLAVVVYIWSFYLSVDAIAAAADIRRQQVVLLYSIPLLLVIASVLALLLLISM